MKYIIEIATTDFTTTKTAVEGGADRIELCAALSDGGTTPSFGMIKKCRENFEVPLFPIIRPRTGDFLYNDEEYAIMLSDILVCKQIDCDGIVIGALKRDGSIDLERMKVLVEAAYPLEVTFHRAFDRTSDPFKALEEIIELGCQRILTSGQQVAAPEGAALIAELVKVADGRIVIMPGSGVRKDNIRQLSIETTATEFHSSLRGQRDSSMNFIHPSFTKADSYTNPAIDAQSVRDLRQALQKI